MKDDHLKKYRGEADDIPEQEDDLELPVLGDGEDRPFGRARPKPCYSLHVIRPNGEVQTFQYFQLDGMSEYKAGEIRLRFIGAKVWDVLIEGRKLWELYDYIHQHRMPWLRIAARDFDGDGTSIRSVTVKAVEPPTGVE
jgi:hypothetical protein